MLRVMVSHIKKKPQIIGVEVIICPLIASMHDNRTTRQHRNANANAAAIKIEAVPLTQFQQMTRYLVDLSLNQIIVAVASSQRRRSCQDLVRQFWTCQIARKIFHTFFGDPFSFKCRRSRLVLVSSTRRKRLDEELVPIMTFEHV